MGLQAGLDVWAAANDNHRNQIGVFVGRTRAQGKTTGLALGWENVQVGQNRLDDKHVGLYWTLTGSTGGYIDAVAMQSRYDGRVRSSRGLGFGIKGDDTSVSVEAGKPLLHAPRWMTVAMRYRACASTTTTPGPAASACAWLAITNWPTTAGSRTSSSITGTAAPARIASASTTT
ncbi:hypothetical protein G6F45_013512 [Rhizopus arrhizus]|nr:hypothetical protein G6F45_013512 [Rhizopus arrhizus]